MGHLATSELVDASKVINNESKTTQLNKFDITTANSFSDNCFNASNLNKSDKMDINTINGHLNGNSNGSLKFYNKSELNVTEDIKDIEHVKDIDENEHPDFDGPTILGVKFKAPLKWDKVITIGLSHLAFVYAVIQYACYSVHPLTTLWALAMGGCAGFGITGGVHRMWTHRAYKANIPLRIILMLCYAVAGQNTIFEWVRDHRVHHKYSETDADPHNSNRGFFFAHVGWLMMHKHPEVLRRGRQLDMSDVLDDPVVKFHLKYFALLKILFCFVLPTLVPVYFWKESWYWAFMSQVIIRYVTSLNCTWSVNSAAHMWGYKPYDRNIKPTENITVSVLALGEGWHNYHHVFPWDYKAAELGAYTFNLTTFWIDLFAKIGWAYDLKEPSKELLKKTIEKSGDGSHPEFGHSHSPIEIPMPNKPIEYDENSNHVKSM